ncbi:MAG: CBS domain-containing protein [Steroidobacteraceae bacterium]
MALLGQLLEHKGHEVHAVAAGASVIDAIRRMAENHVGALLVMDGGQLIGIVSERDYARKVILQGRSSPTTPVRDIMTSPVVTTTPNDTVDHAMRLMTDRRIRHLPVLQGEVVVGVVSIGDLVRSVIDSQRSTIEALQSYIQG